MRLLGEQDIFKCIDYVDMIRAVEDSFLLYEKNEYLVPERMHVGEKDRTLLIMPCIGKTHFGTKLVTVYPNNRGTAFPVINGLVLLNDLETSETLAIINGPTLTALRTGAVGAISVKYLTPLGISSLGIIGAGIQGYYQVMAISAVRNLHKIAIYDVNADAQRLMAKRLSALLPDAEIVLSASTEELVTSTEVVVTATTAQSPVLPENPELFLGKHVVGIGSFQPHTREFPRAIYGLIDTLYVDTPHAITESGDVAQPLAQGWIDEAKIERLGAFLMRNEQEREQARERTTVFKSVGMAAFDLAAAQCIYQKALDKNIGLDVVL